MKASLLIAVISVFKFYLALKTHLRAHKPLAKLLAFKIVVIFTFILSVRLCLVNIKLVSQANSPADYFLDPYRRKAPSPNLDPHVCGPQHRHSKHDHLHPDGAFIGVLPRCVLLPTIHHFKCCLNRYKDGPTIPYPLPGRFSGLESLVEDDEPGRDYAGHCVRIQYGSRVPSVRSAAGWIRE
jgi:Organic solute transporter Ostalpha